MGILDFSKFELSIKFHEPPPHPLTPLPQMGILDFSKFELSIKFHEPPHLHELVNARITLSPQLGAPRLFHFLVDGSEPKYNKI